MAPCNGAEGNKSRNNRDGNRGIGIKSSMSMEITMGMGSSMGIGSTKGMGFNYSNRFLDDLELRVNV